MKSSILNVLRVGAGGLLCASFLVACADGRGSNGFKPYQYSKSEMTANKAKMDAKTAALNKSKIPAAAAVTDGSDATKAAEVKSAELSAEALDQSKYSPDSDDEAKRKFMVERGQVAVQTPTAALRVSNEQAVAVAKGQALPELSKMVKGLTLTSSVSNKEMFLSIDALVLIDNEEHKVFVQGAPMKFSENGNTANLPFRLVKNEADVASGTKLFLTAICEDESCKDVQIRFSFEVENGVRAAAVVGYEHVGNEWKLKKSNIGATKSFDEALALGKGSAAPIQKSESDKAAAPAQATESDKAAATVTGAAPEQKLSDEQRMENQRVQEEAEAFKRAAAEGTVAPATGSVVNEEVKAPAADAQKTEKTEKSEKTEKIDTDSAAFMGVI